VRGVEDAGFEPALFLEHMVVTATYKARYIDRDKQLGATAAAERKGGGEGGGSNSTSFCSPLTIALIIAELAALWGCPGASLCS
jgi:hypothetical protein